MASRTTISVWLLHIVGEALLHLPRSTPTMARGSQSLCRLLCDGFSPLLMLRQALCDGFTNNYFGVALLHLPRSTPTMATRFAVVSVAPGFVRWLFAVVGVAPGFVRWLHQQLFRCGSCIFLVKPCFVCHSPHHQWRLNGLHIYILFTPSIFVNMGISRLPKTIRWILFSNILLLVLLTAYRYVIYLLFPNLFGDIKSGLAQAFWYGVRFDGRITGIFTLLIFLLSFYPGKHFFKSDEGRKVAMWVTGFFITVIMLFYVADFGYLRNFNARLNGSLISDLAKNTEKGLVYKSKTEWFFIVPAMLIIIAFYLFMVYKIHSVINNKRGTTSFGNRLTWQIVLVLLCLLGIYASVTTHMLTMASARQSLSPTQLMLAANPFESLWRTMPGKDQ